MKRPYLIHTILILCAFCHGSNYDSNNKINQLALTMALLKQNYIDSMNNDEIAEKAIRGLLNQLDPHSDYLDINDYSTLNDTTNAEVTGIGIEVTIDDGLLKVVAPLDESPAARAGIKNGDLITHVNNNVVFDIGIKEAVAQIKGKVGTSVNITVIRQGHEKPLSFNIIRELIKAPTVRSEMLNNNIGYLRISYFSMPTTNEVKMQVQALMRKNKKMSGLIIDLRNNPGGTLDSAIEVSDLFLNKATMKYQGTIAIAKERSQKVTQAFKSKTGDMTHGIPIAVIINSGSASGAEIMAGALKDHNRATLIGETSFGKGSIQTVMPLSETAAIKITTGLYYTPSGRVVQQNGIDPDILSPQISVSKPNTISRMREADYLKSIESKKKSTDTAPSNHDKKIIQKYGIEIYQAIQSLTQQQKELNCQ